MFELEQIRLGLSGYDEKLEEMGGSLDVAGAREKIAELEELSADPDFWNDLEKSQKTLQQLKALKNKVGKLAIGFGIVKVLGNSVSSGFHHWFWRYLETCPPTEPYSIANSG